MIDKKTSYTIAFLCAALVAYAAIQSQAAQVPKGKRVVAKPMVCDGGSPSPTCSPGE